MKKSEMLKRVKELLWDGNGACTPRDKYHHICHALKRSGGSAENYEILKRWILLQISPHTAFGAWLDIELGYSATDQQEMEARHQWLDHMIKVCEEMRD